MIEAVALVCLGVRVLGYLGLTWLVVDTLRRSARQIAHAGSRRAVAGGVVCLVGTVLAALAFFLSVARDSGALDRLLTLG